MHGTLNGEVRVVRHDLNNEGYDKTQTQRIEDAIKKVTDLAEIEPDLEVKMQSHLLETKERGNLSFYKDEDFVNTSDTLAEVSKDPDLSLASLLSSSGNTNAHSKCALLCEAIKALERGK